MFRIQLITTMMALLLVASWGRTDNLKKLSDVAFNDFETAIGELAFRTDSPAIIQEIKNARRQIVHGKLLLRAGRTKKAAAYAERLHVQIELIRALISASDAMNVLGDADREILDMESTLKTLRDRLHRLKLEMANKKIKGAAQPAPTSPQ